MKLLFLLVCYIGVAVAVQKSFISKIIDLKKPEVYNEDYDDVPEGRNPCVCQKTDVYTDFSSQCMLNSYRRNIMEKFWKKNTPTLTNMGTVMKGQIKSLRNSDVARWKNNAYIMTFMTAVLYPYAKQMVTTCGMVGIINAVVDNAQTMDGTYVQKALDDMVENLPNNTARMTRSALISAGCKASSINVDTGTCDPSSAKIAQLWALNGDLYPCSYKNLAIQMSKSENYTDKIMAIAATFAATDVAAELFNGLNKNPTVAAQMQNALFSPLISSCCCKERQNHIKMLATKFRSNFKKTTSGIKLKYPKKT